MNTQRGPYKRLSEDEWKRLLKEHERRGESAATFAARNGLALSTFQRWQQRLRRPTALSKVNSFLPLTLAAEALRELSFPNGVNLRFPTSIPAQTLRCWLDVLESR